MTGEILREGQGVPTVFKVAFASYNPRPRTRKAEEEVLTEKLIAGRDQQQRMRKDPATVSHHGTSFLAALRWVRKKRGELDKRGRWETLK